MQILSILFSASITNNVVFCKALGVCPFLKLKNHSTLVMGIAFSLITILSAIICWLINTIILLPYSLEYLQTTIFVLVIISLTLGLDQLLKHLAPKHYNSITIYLALLITNCAILGTINQIVAFTLLNTVLTAFATGVGYTLALILMQSLRIRLQTAPIPKFFKGLSITLIAVAIMSMAFMGFKGISFV